METFRGFDKTLFAVTVILVLAGIVMVFSASGVMAQDRHGDKLYFLVQQVAGAALGFALLAAIVRTRRAVFLSPWAVYGLLGVSAALLALCFAMPAVANANRWVILFGFRFQPSELAKISLVLFLAFYAESKRDRLNEPRTLAVPLGVLLLFVLLILKEPNLSGALLVAAISGVMLFAAGVRLRWFAALLLCLGVVFGVSLIRRDYQMGRVTSFFSAEKDPLKEGFQVNQSKMAVGSGGILGVSLGNSRQKLYFLPFAHTDFIYAILGEEFGLVGTFSVLALFGLFLWRGLVVAFRAQNPAHRCVAAGLTIAVVGQALLNISVVLGIGPVTGVPLPFLSYGRSSLICSLAAAGILLNISRRRSEAGVRT